MHVHAVPCSCLNSLFKTVVNEPKDDVIMGRQLVQLVQLQIQRLYRGDIELVLYHPLMMVHECTVNRERGEGKRGIDCIMGNPLDTKPYSRVTVLA